MLRILTQKSLVTQKYKLILDLIGKNINNFNWETCLEVIHNWLNIIICKQIHDGSAKRFLEIKISFSKIIVTLKKRKICKFEYFSVSFDMSDC